MGVRRECWCRYPQAIVTHDRYPYECAVCGGVVRSVSRYGRDWRAVSSKKKRRGFWAEVLPVIGRVVLYGIVFVYLVLLMFFIAAVGEP